MKKIVPHNPIFRLINIFNPIQWGKQYILIENGTITFSRYYCFDGKVLKRHVSNINIHEIVELGFPEELGINPQEKIIDTPKGVYYSQEIIFKTTTSVIGFNVRPYTKKQIREFIVLLLENNPEIRCGKRLKRILGINN